MTTKAIGYCRVSGTSQAADDRDGLPRQRRAVAAYCRSKRLELVEVIEDAGISGATPLAARPGLSRALARCIEAGAVLVVENATRLARDLVVAELVVHEFCKVEVSIIVADTGADLTENSSPTGRLLRQVVAAVSEHERASLVVKLRAARNAKRAAGGHSEGDYRFGKHPQKPHEAETMARIAELRRRVPSKRRMTMAAVADVLNAEQRPSRSGRPWNASMVRDLLAS